MTTEVNNMGSKLEITKDSIAQQQALIEAQQKLDKRQALIEKQNID